MTRCASRRHAPALFLALLALLAPLVTLLLAYCTPTRAAQQLTHGCGGWLMSRDGWGCYRLAPNYELYHKVVNDTLHLGLDVWPGNNTGLTQLDWIGIGISEAGGMPGADIAVLARNTSSPRGWELWDMFARGFTRPDMDAQQDKTLLAVQERADGRVRARMSFALTSCDQQQDRAVRPGIPSYLIYAFGQGDFEYHGVHNRGDAVLLLAPEHSSTTSTGNASTSINTTLPAAPPAGPPKARRDTSSMTLNLLMPSLPIPTNDTDPYICLDFELPGTLEQPFHLTEYVITENTTGPTNQPHYVHHVVLYNCSSRPPTLGHGPYECSNTPSMCSTFTLVATHGGTASTILPEAAGYRMGVGAMRYVTMQVHYNNVNLDEGLVDSSGFKLTYTPKLRPNDMGTLTTGVVGFVVPARSRWSPGPNICPPSCTRRFGKPVTLVSNLLHMHQIGYNMSIQHYREVPDANTNASNTSATNSNATSSSSHWVELEPTGNRAYFDFGFQPFMPIPPSTSTLLPGDALVTTCTFNNRYNRPVPMGLRSSDEMCFGYIMYYPITDISLCSDTPDSNSTGFALCQGSNDDDVMEQLGQMGSLTPEQQQQVLTTAVQRGVLAPRQPDMLASATPFVRQLPPSCPVA